MVFLCRMTKFEMTKTNLMDFGANSNGEAGLESAPIRSGAAIELVNCQKSGSGANSAAPAPEQIPEPESTHPYSLHAMHGRMYGDTNTCFCLSGHSPPQPVQVEDTQCRHSAFIRLVGSVISSSLPILYLNHGASPETSGAGPNVIFFIHL